MSIIFHKKKKNNVLYNTNSQFHNLIPQLNIKKISIIFLTCMAPKITLSHIHTCIYFLHKIKKS